MASCFLSQTHPHTHGFRAVNTHPLHRKQNASVIPQQTQSRNPPACCSQPAPTGSVPTPRPPPPPPLLTPPGQRAATPAVRCLCQCGTISQAATGKRQNTHTETHTPTYTLGSLHSQRMTVHDSGVFQRLNTWTSGMHHSISTMSSLMGLNSSVNHGDHLSRGGETG